MSENAVEETPVVVYVIYDDGTTERQTYTGQGTSITPTLTKPGRIVTETEYLNAAEAVRAANQAAAADLQAQEQATIKGDYDALIAAGVPDATVRRLTGHRG